MMRVMKIIVAMDIIAIVITSGISIELEVVPL
jgi:hypothetical protein